MLKTENTTTKENQATKNHITANVTRTLDIATSSIERFVESHGMQVSFHPDGSPIPGSFWGDSEAGLIKNTLHLRPDTPIHSLLHEMCHYLCMDEERKKAVHTDAGGDYEEENGVCYLQIILADEIDGYSRDTCMRDMDTWGYTFRLGSTRRWFEEDAEDALAWLQERGIL